MAKHWTEESTDSFVSRLSFDFITQLAKRMESLPLMQAELANILGVTEGRVSQILNNPGNLGLRKIIEYARALQMKVAVVAYDDNDPENERGPINPDIFRICWERCDRPVDFFDVNEDQPFALSNTVSGTFPYVDLFPANAFVIGTTFAQVGGQSVFYRADQPPVASVGDMRVAANTNKLPVAA